MTEEDIKSIKFCGRGGQGIVTAGELLALAAFQENKFAQAVPHFGAERRGGPAFCSLRISNMPILLKCNVGSTDTICLFDQTIWHHRNMFVGLKPGGILIFNTQKSGETIAEELKSGKYGFTINPEDFRIYTIDATSLALDILKKPIVNTAIMGSFAKATEYVSLDSIVEVIKGHMKRNIDENIELAEKAYQSVAEYKSDTGK
jgi:2-oxoacid:acceptor oxidoreductase gamma subunit (pyruvate/2-ketoisovalerate family)